ncbi:hypothetical protein [Tetragenococcus koreensis]|uniref:hypothetical protein n=1 Tax=Tetragenococcus koreensis TaxID=290335 RepID=UPI001F1FBF2F|nr:hypothetical protein [Tetragenococcus koreensis]MCF1632923.1 hypothetical protein [Tetragenococcus koreensis]
MNKTLMMYDLADDIKIFACVLNDDFKDKSATELKSQIKLILDGCNRLSRCIDKEVSE